jgi:hypothetical protein
MSEESEAVLRNSLDAVDRFRRRAIAAVVVLFVATVVGLASLMGMAAGRAGGNAGQTKILFTSAASQMVFVAVCTVVVALYITRMTRTILRAIELTSKAPPK